MRIDITINKKACDELKSLVHYRLNRLSRMNYSCEFRLYEKQILNKLLEMLYNLEKDKELIL